MMNTIKGRVESIKTASTGTSTIVITGDISGQSKGSVVFYSPKDMTEQQLSELKRAQNGSLGVRLEFDEDRTINSMDIGCVKELTFSQKSSLFIDEATGNVGIGTDSINEDNRLHVDGNLYVDGELNVTGLAYSNGELLTSDRRMKNDTPLDDALGLLLKLRGVKYKWKQECQEEYSRDCDDKEHVGFIAQEIEDLATEEEIFLGWSSDKGKSYKVNSETFNSYIVHATPAAFQALTVESIRELDQKIDSLNQALTTVGTALANLQAEQLRQADRIKKLEEGR
ncbi:MAG: tail fiber domain-containing protein [Candidatus Electrothrix sp. Rat3]|nr:tail fiber domain-containing protein [Candidatus Electrothrix rattekaaiensis]